MGFTENDVVTHIRSRVCERYDSLGIDDQSSSQRPIFEEMKMAHERGNLRYPIIDEASKTRSQLTPEPTRDAILDRVCGVLPRRQSVYPEVLTTDTKQRGQKRRRRAEEFDERGNWYNPHGESLSVQPGSHIGTDGAKAHFCHLEDCGRTPGALDFRGAGTFMIM